MNQTFRLVPPAAAGRNLAVGLGLSLAVLAVLILRTRVPAAALATLLGAALIFYVAWSMRHVEIVVSASALAIRRDLFGKTIPRAALLVKEAREISLRTDSGHRPLLRLCGTGLPGYLAGWFRLRNGERALAFLTDQTHVVYVPTTRGFSVLLSVAQPEAFLRSIQKVQESG